MKTSFTSKTHFIYSILLFLFAISSCKNAETPAGDSAVDSTAVNVDTTSSVGSAAPDSAIGTPPNAPVLNDTMEVVFGNEEIDTSAINPRMGKVAFYCENENMNEGEIFEMKEERSYEMIAMLNPIIENDQIKSEILKVINESKIENNEKPLTINQITSRNVILGNYLKIQIKDPYNKFIINLVSNDSNTYIKKIYDDVTKKYINENFEWRWNVTPKPDSKGKTKLSLVISPLNKNKEIIKEQIKTYAININFKQSFLASLWDKMNRNIEWAIASIIAPIVIFVVGRITKKKE